MEPSDVSGPLALFQATKPMKDDLLHLIKTLYKALEKPTVSEAQIDAAFDLVWPKLEQKLQSLPTDGPAGRPHRTDRELLEEMVGWVRSTSDGQTVLLAEVRETMDRFADRLANIDGRASLRDKYIWETGNLKNLNNLGSNSYGELFKSGRVRLIDEAQTSYAEAAKGLGSETPPSLGDSDAKGVATPVGLRAAARKAGAPVAPKPPAKK
jgi:hypothetical protein